MKFTSDYILENRIQAGFFKKKKTNLNLFLVQYEDLYDKDFKTFYTLAEDESEIEKSFSNNKNYKFSYAEQIPDNDLSHGDRDAEFYDLDVIGMRGDTDKEFKVRVKGVEGEFDTQIRDMGYSIISLKKSANQNSNQKQSPQPAHAELFHVTIQDSDGHKYTVSRKGPYSRFKKEMDSKGFTIIDWWDDNSDNQDSIESAPAQPAPAQPAPTQPAPAQPAPAQPAPTQPAPANVFQDNQVVNLLLKKGLTGVDIKKLVNKGIMISNQSAGVSSSRGLFMTPYYTRLSAQPSQGEQKSQRRPYNIFSDPDVVNLLKKKGLPQEDIEDLYWTRAKKLYQRIPKYQKPVTQTEKNPFWRGIQKGGQAVGRFMDNMTSPKNPIPAGMTRFKCDAVNNQGQAFKLYVDARTKTEALQFVKNEGYWAQSITPLTRKSSLNLTSYYTRVSGSVFESDEKHNKNNPWAICTSQVGRDDTEKYEDCIMSVKKKTHYHD